MSELKLTPARRRALDVLVKADGEGKPARISNQTREASLHVYWQCADWLAGNLLARIGADLQTLSITEIGREADRQLAGDVL